MRRIGYIVGPSGIGKGYGLGAVLVEYHEVSIFVTGDWCRDKANELASQGIMVDDALIVQAVKDDYNARGRPNHYLVDCPRSIAQVDMLNPFFSEFGDFDLVLWEMRAMRSTCEQRIIERACRQGRHDDANPEAIKRRLDTYYCEGGIQETVVPYLTEMAQHHLIVEADPALETIRDTVRSALAPMVYRRAPVPV